MALESSHQTAKTVEDRERVIVRFAGDSGQGRRHELAGDEELDALLSAGDTRTVA